MLWLLSFVGPLVMAIGLALMPGGVRRQEAGRERAVGKVTAWDHASVGGFTSHGRTRSLPIVVFRTAEGRDVEGMPPVAADRGIYRTGQAIDVLYDPANPEDFRVRAGWLDRPYAFVVVAGAGLTFLTLLLPIALQSVIN